MNIKNIFYTNKTLRIITVCIIIVAILAGIFHAPIGKAFQYWNDKTYDVLKHGENISDEEKKELFKGLEDNSITGCRIDFIKHQNFFEYVTEDYEPSFVEIMNAEGADPTYHFVIHDDDIGVPVGEYWIGRIYDEYVVIECSLTGKNMYYNTSKGYQVLYHKLMSLSYFQAIKTVEYRLLTANDLTIKKLGNDYMMNISFTDEDNADKNTIAKVYDNHINFVSKEINNHKFDCYVKYRDVYLSMPQPSRCTIFK